MIIKRPAVLLLLFFFLAEGTSSAYDLCYDLVEKREFIRAVETCTVIINGDADRASLAINHNNRARAYFALGKYDEALEDLDKAIGYDPGYFWPYVNRGNVHCVRAEFDRAVADYKKAAGLNPESPNAYTGLGNALSALGRYGDAVAEYDKAVKADPKYHKAYTSRGNAYAALNRYKDAIADHDRAIGLRPRHAYAYDSRANARYASGDFVNAAEDYRKAVELNPKDDYHRLRLVIALGKASRDDYAKARGELKDFVINAPSSEWIRTVSKYYLGMDGLTEEKVLAEARGAKTERKALERLVEAYYYLGEKRLMDGDRAGAAEFFNKGVETRIFDFAEYIGSKAVLRLIDDGRL